MNINRCIHVHFYVKDDVNTTDIIVDYFSIIELKFKLIFYHFGFSLMCVWLLLNRISSSGLIQLNPHISLPRTGSIDPSDLQILTPKTPYSPPPPKMKLKNIYRFFFFFLLARKCLIPALRSRNRF